MKTKENVYAHIHIHTYIYVYKYISIFYTHKYISAYMSLRCFLGMKKFFLKL